MLGVEKENQSDTLKTSGKMGDVKNEQDIAPTVHISAKTTDEENLQAEYTLFFGPSDCRNKTAVIQGELAIQRADLTAWQKVLEQFLHTSIRTITIATDSKYIFMVDKFRKRWRSNGWTTEYGAELLNERNIQLVDTLMNKFEKVTIQLVPGPRNNNKA